MNWEVEDYRKKEPTPDLGSWPFWSVPAWYVPLYLLRVIFWVFVLPWAFGQTLTALGTLITFCLIDYWIYWSMKKAYGQE
jgi:hypothetical protein